MTEKFGIPRQGCLAPALQGTIVFEPEYRKDGILKGLEAYSHLWLIWGFSENAEEPWNVTVRPPKLGGKKRLSVFATRSPLRPNSLGLSAVRLESLEQESSEGPVIHVSGVDLMDGTPIYDIKPYLPYADAISEAKSGYACPTAKLLEAVLPPTAKTIFSSAQLDALRQILSCDPRPAFHHDPNREYRMSYEGHTIVFVVNEETLIVTDIL